MRKARWIIAFPDTRFAPNAIDKLSIFVSLLLLFALGSAPRADADGFELSGTSFTIIDAPGSYAIPGENSTGATGINDEGVVIGTYQEVNAPSVNQIYLYSGGKFTLINPPAGVQVSLTYGINDTGQFIIDTSVGDLLYSNGTFTSVPGATGINNNGQIVGDNGSSGFILAGNSYVYFNMPGAISFDPLAINDNGQVVGVYTNAKGEFGFLYSGGTFTTIGCPSNTLMTGDALGINDAGAIVGDCEGLGHDNGFLYVNGDYTLVDVPFHDLNEALAINNENQIVGFTGDSFMIPEPDSLTLLLFGLMVVAGLSRCRGDLFKGERLDRRNAGEVPALHSFRG